MDQKLLFLINRQWTGPVRDHLFALFSSFDAWVPLLAVLLGLVLWRGGFRARTYVLAVGLIVGINDGLVGATLKKLVDRPRPHQAIDDVRLVDLAKATPRLLALFKPLKIKYSQATERDVEGRSFPSSHTVNTTSAALITACFFRRWGWLAFIPSLLVGYSRIYTGSHWPSDVLTSIFLGLGTTLLLLGAVEWLWRTCGGRFLPAVHSRHPSLLAA